MLTALLLPAMLAAGYAAEPPAAARNGTGTSAAVVAPVRYVITATGNEARYRVREQLAGLDLPNDAVGVTNRLTGAIVIGDNGQPIAAQSKIVVDATELKTDNNNRDNYVRRNTLQTEQFRTIELVPTSFRGLPAQLPTSGTHSFELVGNLKIRDQTRSVVWRVTAQFSPGRVTGTAVTRFTFADFNMTQPSVSRVLGVSNAIGLEYDFNMIAMPS